jgi:Tol biopolymer transport system component
VATFRRVVLLLCLVAGAPACDSGPAKAKDQTPPAAVSDLAIAGSTITTLTLRWTAPGNDGNSGTASSYEIRSSTTTITAGTWGSATLVAGVPTPLLAGTIQTFTVTGLAPNTAYFFALKTTDAAGNVSALSNVLAASTTPGHVGYVADANVVGAPELFVADDQGTMLVNVSAGLGTVAVNWFVWSPDGTKIAFMATVAGVRELYVVSSSGGPVTKVSGPMVAGGNVQIMYWAPDNSRLLYIAEQDTVTVRELYTVRPDGTGRVKISGPMAAGGTGVAGPIAAWSPDSSRIAYPAFQDSSTVSEVYTSLPDGTGNVKVSGTLVAGGTTGFPAWSPDGSKLAYPAMENTLNAMELFTVSPDGTGRVRVCPPFAAGQSVTSLLATLPVRFNNWSKDSQRLVYIANQDSTTSKDLYSVKADGTGNVKLSGTLASGANVTQFQWQQGSGARVAYSADQDTKGVIELYSSLAAGGGNVKVSAPLAPGGHVEAPSTASGSFFWSWDGSRIAYRADGTPVGTRELYTALPDTAAGTVKVSGTLLGTEVTDFSWSADSARILYRAQETTAGIYDLYSTLAGGGGRVKLSPTISSGSGVLVSVQASAFSPRMFFRTATSNGSPIELYAALPDGSSTLRISGPVVSGGNVQFFFVR